MTDKLDEDKRGSFRRIMHPTCDEVRMVADMRKRQVPAARIPVSVSWIGQYFARMVGAGAQWWRNSNYLVQITEAQALALAEPGCPPVLWLRVYRHDGKRLKNHWRELQQIKNELVGPECQGVEFYPPESELQDGENSYHLWVFARPTTRHGFGIRDKRNLGADGCSAAASTRFITSSSRGDDYLPDASPYMGATELRAFVKAYVDWAGNGSQTNLSKTAKIPGGTLSKFLAGRGMTPEKIAALHLAAHRAWPVKDRKGYWPTPSLTLVVKNGQKVA